MLLKKDLTEYNRYQAFTFHMAISLIIFFALLICITQYWYPGILFDTGNGWKAIGIIIGVDLILGPLLTLIIFNPKKKSIKFDLSVIALVQTAALVYGSWTIHQSRPIALAFIYQSFSTIYANAPFAGQIKDIAEKSNGTLIYLSDIESTSYKLNPELFKDYSQHLDQVLLKARKLSESQPEDTKESYYIPLTSLSDKENKIQIDAKTGKIIQYLPAN